MARKKKLTKTDAISSMAYLAIAKAFGGPGINKLIGLRGFFAGLKFLDDD